MNDDALRVLIAETVNRAIAQTSVPMFRPGTVTAVSGTYPLVLVDGDATASEMSSWIGDDLYVGQRVIVVYHPPAGVAVIGSISAPSQPICVVYDAAQSIDTSAPTVINPWGTVLENPYGFSTATGQITPNIPGWYIAIGHAMMVTAVAGTTLVMMSARIKRNSAQLSPDAVQRTMPTIGSVLSWTAGITSSAVEMNGTTDYFELEVFQQSGSTRAMETTLTVVRLAA